MTSTGSFHDLPILDYKDQILELVDQNQVTILTAETGAGKSTQVPQYLAEHGYQRIIVTQPRILAARNLSNRVRDEWTERNLEDSSQKIGYRTAHERDDSGRTEILYCTDGLQLVRELTGSGISQKQVLVLDEVHEWNENMEVLVAWAKKRCQQEPDFKVVIMSATIETNALAEYYSTSAVIDVPGRHFPVSKRKSSDLVAELFNYIEDSSPRNVLTFLPGKAEIQQTLEVLEKKANAADIPIIPLHSQLELEQQQKAFMSYPNGKIILATNIAQTSITIDDIDVVVDSGLERRAEVRNGVEGLFMGQISQADSLQRAGRAGRTRPGEYVLAQFGAIECLDFEARDQYPTPEILRKHIDRLTLRLANIGIDIEELDFYHDPSKKAISRAKRTLTTLGAMTDKGQVTDIGRQMEQFPVESKYGRMLVEVRQYDVRAQAKLAAIIAIQEIGGIIKGGSRYTGWRSHTKQTKSDLLAEYDVYLATPQINPDDYEELGIISKNLAKAEEVIERLHKDLGLGDVALELIMSDEEDPLMRSIVAGQIDQLWQVVGDEVENIFSKQRRELSSSTVVRNPKLIAGTPFDLQVPMRGGNLQTLHLVQGVTVVNTDWLLELAPQLFDTRKSRLVFDPRIGGLAERQQIRFGKRVLEGYGRPVLEDTNENRQAFVREFTAWAYQQIDAQRRNLEQFHRRVPAVPQNVVEREVKSRSQDIVSIDQLPKHQKRQFMALAKLETYFDDNFFHRLGRPHRDHARPQHRRKGWKPKHKSGKHRYN